MIKKVTSGQEFEKAFRDLEALFKEENTKYGHAYLAINPNSVIDSFAHSTMLNSSIYCWANFENGLVDGMIMFMDSMHPFLNQRIFSECFWISKNPKKSFALYNQAIKFAKSKGIEYINMNCVENYPTSEKLKKIYQKMGFKKDTESYIKKI
jgi:hypothetical protein